MPNNEVLDLLSRVPDDEMLVSLKITIRPVANFSHIC